MACLNNISTSFKRSNIETKNQSEENKSSIFSNHQRRYRIFIPDTASIPATNTPVARLQSLNQLKITEKIRTEWKSLIGKLKGLIHEAHNIQKNIGKLKELKIFPIYNRNKVELKDEIYIWINIIHTCPKKNRTTQLADCLRISNLFTHELNPLQLKNPLTDKRIFVVKNTNDQVQGALCLNLKDLINSDYLAINLLCASPNRILDRTTKKASIGLLLIMKAAQISLYYNKSGIQLVPLEGAVPYYKKLGFEGDEFYMTLAKSKFSSLLSHLTEVPRF